MAPRKDGGRGGGGSGGSGHGVVSHHFFSLRSERLEAFLDSFFAVVATMLSSPIIRLPAKAISSIACIADNLGDDDHVDKHASSASCNGLAHLLDERGVQLVVFGFTFALICFTWQQHARSMLGVEHVHIALLFVNVFLLMPLNAFLPATVALESFYLSTPRAAIAWYSNVTLAAFVMWLHTVLASKSRSAAAASALHPQVVALLRRERSIVLGFAGWCLVCLVLAIADFASGFVLGLFIVGFLMLGPLLPAALYIRKKALRCAKVCCRKSRTPPPVRPSASASISFAPHVDSTPTRLRFREAAIDVSRLISFSDGVFGVVATMIVLNLQLPQFSDRPEATIAEWSKHNKRRVAETGVLLLTTGALWVAHHSLFAMVKREVSRMLFLLNTALLAIVVLLPFTLTLVGTFSTTAFPMLILTIHLAVISILFVTMLVYILAFYGDSVATMRRKSLRIVGLTRSTSARATAAEPAPPSRAAAGARAGGGDDVEAGASQAAAIARASSSERLLRSRSSYTVLDGRDPAGSAFMSVAFVLWCVGCLILGTLAALIFAACYTAAETAILPTLGVLLAPLAASALGVPPLARRLRKTRCCGRPLLRERSPSVEEPLL